MAVYVSLAGDGSGIVVDPDTTLPEDLVIELETIEGVPTDAGHLAEQLGSLDSILTAHNEAGTKVIAIFAMAPTASGVRGVRIEALMPPAAAWADGPRHRRRRGSPL